MRSPLNMFKRRLIATIAVGAMLTGCTGDAPEFSLVIAHEDPADHYFHASFEYFKDIVEERSEGRIGVKIVPNELFGTMDALTTAVQLNSIQMTAPTSGILGQFAPSSNVWDTPYLFDNPEHAHRVLDGEIGRELLGALEKVDLVGLGYWEVGVRHLTTKGSKVDGPDDLARVKIRVQPNALQLRAWNATSANPTPMAYGEVYTGLQQGTIDAQENPLALIVSQRFYEVQDNVILTGHVHSTAPLIMSKIFYDSLPGDLQQIINQAAVKSVEFNRMKAAEAEIESADIIKAAGVSISEISETGRAAFRKTMQSAALPYLRQIVGDSTINRLEAAIEEARL